MSETAIILVILAIAILGIVSIFIFNSKNQIQTIINSPRSKIQNKDSLTNNIQ